MQIKTQNLNCHTADSKPVKQEVNGTVILTPLVFPAYIYGRHLDLKALLVILKSWAMQPFSCKTVFKSVHVSMAGAELEVQNATSTKSY